MGRLKTPYLPISTAPGPRAGPDLVFFRITLRLIRPASPSGQKGTLLLLCPYLEVPCSINILWSCFCNPLQKLTPEGHPGHRMGRRSLLLDIFPERDTPPLLGGDSTVPFGFIAQRLISRLEFDWIRTAGSLGQHHALLPRFIVRVAGGCLKATCSRPACLNYCEEDLTWGQHTVVRRGDTRVPAHGAQHKRAVS